jgi:hypothetical protein
VVLSMVAQGLGIAVLPQLTLTDTPAGVTVTSLGAAPPVLKMVAVTTRATAATVAVREFIRELQATASKSLPLTTLDQTYGHSGTTQCSWPVLPRSRPPPLPLSQEAGPHVLGTGL